jgi:hypothetical protein
MVVEWELDDKRCACTGGTLERHRAAVGLHAVFQADQSGAAGGVGAARAFVADGNTKDLVSCLDGDMDDRGEGVLGRVRQRLGDDVVRGRFDVLRQPRLDRDVKLDGDGRTAGEHLEGRFETSPRQDCGMEAARELAEVVENAVKPFSNPRQSRAEIMALDQVFRLADRICVLRRGRQVGVRRTSETTSDEIVAMITGLR